MSVGAAGSACGIIGWLDFLFQMLSESSSKNNVAPAAAPRRRVGYADSATRS